MIHLRALARCILCSSTRTEIDNNPHELPSRPKAKDPREGPCTPEQDPHSRLTSQPGATLEALQRVVRDTDGAEELNELMPPKRKYHDAAIADMARPQDKKAKTTPKKGKKATAAAEDVYSSHQKAAIAQFISFTNIDRNTAIRVLKNNGWDTQNAVNR
ncbi:Scaffold-type E3 ligase [Neocucurbitaria cava]|uniref:Scaffold-type E3 ligase n=1 Tax=Neocucurbitaria cava TaxID=798079 RepID=A0A9W8XZS1_9PLEO|nr:Scaffold-type E3 ligase [Neocucurbitaria cava]